MTVADQVLRDYLSAVAGRTSTPGGGAVAAIVAAEACSLVSMVAAFTGSGQAQAIVDRMQAAVHTLVNLADADSAAFSRVMAAYRGDGDLQPALVEAARVPAQVVEACEQATADLQELLESGNRNLLSDVGIAAELFSAALGASEMNIRVNTRALENVPAELNQTLQRIAILVETHREVARRVLIELRSTQ